MISIFIHVASINNYLSILEEFRKRIEESGLIDRVDKIFVSCNSGKKEISLPEKYIITYDFSINKYEFPTLEKLKSYCKSNPSSKVLYIHTKGVTDPTNQCLTDWRNYMSYFLINKFEECLKELEVYDTCGVDLRNDPAEHYSGNFWWANAGYINSLPEFKDMEVVLSERHKAEFWICSGSKNHKSLWDCGINQYQRHLNLYPEKMYKNE